MSLDLINWRNIYNLVFRKQTFTFICQLLALQITVYDEEIYLYL